MEPKIKIIKAAIKVFLLKGYDAASMSDVVVESQTSKGGIYHHFKNKEELFLQCIDFMFDEFEKWEMQIYSHSSDLKTILQQYFLSLAQIQNFVCDLADADDVEVDSFYLLMMEAFTKFPEVKKKHAQAHQQGLEYFVKLLQASQQQNVIKAGLDCNTLGFMINALAEGTVIYHILNDRIDLAEMGQKLFETIWKGISIEE